MSKFLLNLLLQIFKALVNLKIQFLIRKFIFPDFRPGRPHGPLGLWPSHPTGNTTPRRPKAPGRPVQPARRSRLRGKYVFLFGSRLPEPAAFPSVTAMWAPLVSSVVSPTPPLPPRRCLTPWMPLSFYSSLSSLPPLNPLQTER